MAFRSFCRKRNMGSSIHEPHFWAGMNFTQRSESINSFFNGYVSKKIKLFDFVQQYIKALECRANDERQADADSLRFNQKLVTTFPLERTFRNYCTAAKLSEV